VSPSCCSNIEFDKRVVGGSTAIVSILRGFSQKAHHKCITNPWSTVRKSLDRRVPLESKEQRTGLSHKFGRSLLYGREIVTRRLWYHSVIVAHLGRGAGLLTKHAISAHPSTLINKSDLTRRIATEWWSGGSDYTNGGAEVSHTTGTTATTRFTYKILSQSVMTE